jgi:hypothetical protein
LNLIKTFLAVLEHLPIAASCMLPRNTSHELATTHTNG